MLVLSRKQGESIVIGQGICVTIDRVDRHRVRLVIDAPKEVRVDRQEVWLRKHADGGLVTPNAAD